METIRYPLLIYPLQPNTYLGKLVGSSLEAVAANESQLKNKLVDTLKRNYKKTDEYPPVMFNDPKLKMLSIDYQPGYREEGAIYSLAYRFPIAMPLIYGWRSEDLWMGYLPLLESRFFYYQQEHLDPLSRHLANLHLFHAAPEEVFRWLHMPVPKLDTISIRVKERPQDYSFFPAAKQSPTLSQLAESFPFPKNAKGLAQQPEAAWEMDTYVQEIVEHLSTRSSVLVVGHPGSGKTAVLQQALRKMATQYRRQHQPFPCWRIHGQRIVGSAKYLGEWQGTAEGLLKELNATQGVLWVESIMRLLMTGEGTAETSVAAFFRPFLQQGKLQLIGEVTPTELSSMRRLLPGFVDCFQVVQLQAMDPEKIQRILEHFAHFSQTNLRVQITAGARNQAYRLLDRYYPYESFPGKAIKFLGQCVSQAQQQQEQQVTQRDVMQHFIRESGMPEMLLNDQLSLAEKDLRHFFTTRIIGQPQVIEQFVSLVKVVKAGLHDPKRPIATLFFAGPTGVGKSASAKALASYFFGQNQRSNVLVQFDMSEFQTPMEIGRLIGQGGEPGRLVKEIRDRPFSVLLLDEIEKAHPSLFDALLTVLDDGILYDAYGRLTNFKNTIIIMTSNLGANQLNTIGFQQTTRTEDQYHGALLNYFRPEFVNRIDHLIVFNPLQETQIRAIAQKELQEFQKREGIVKRGITLHFTEALVQHLVHIGFDERYGARPLQRVIDRWLADQVAIWMHENPTLFNCTLNIDYQDIINISLVENNPSSAPES